MSAAKGEKIVLISLYPEYARAILEGRKRVEFRRGGIPRDVERFVLYATAPVRQVLGHVRVERCEVASPEVLWEAFGEVGVIDEKGFHDYYQDRAEGRCFVLADPRPFSVPLPLATFGLRAGPQSFKYVTPDAWRTVADGA